MSRPTQEEKIDFVRQRWSSLRADGVPLESEVAAWLVEYPLHVILHGVTIALREHNRHVARGHAGYQEDEAIKRCEEIMAAEREAHPRTEIGGLS